jgi:transposase-like protein
LTSSEEERRIRGIAILSSQYHVKRINKLHYRLKSQSSKEDEIWYDVVKQYGHNIGGHREGEWTCSCPDFKYRLTVCKHVFAILYLKQARKKITYRGVLQEQSSPTVLSSRSTDLLTCPKCKSESIVKNGVREAKHNHLQRYRCNTCHYRFIDNVGFERSKANPKAVTAALDLYFKGVSFRKVSDHLQQLYGIKITHVAVINWIRKFADIVGPFVDSLKPPHLSGIYHVDEMMVHVRREKMEVGHYQWLWNMMDNSTRFWISGMVSQNRATADARAVFRDSKNKSTSPRAIIHDGLHTYSDAFNKEYFTLKTPRVKNIRSISVRNQGLNSLVERLHGTIRDREKVMRGMQTKETAHQIIEAMRIYYNYVRVHSTLKKTPAQKAGIQLDLQGNKIETLIRLSAKC